MNKNALDSYMAMVIYFVISIFLCLGAFFLEEINSIAWICFLETFFSLCFLWKLNYRFSSFPFLFILFTFLFHASQFWVNTFVDEYDKPFDVLLIAGETASIFTIRFTLLSIVMMTIGIYLSLFLCLNRRSQKTVISLNDLGNIGKKMIIACFIPRLYIDITLFLARLEGGYLSTYNQNISGIFFVLGIGFYIGVIWYMIGNKENFSKCNRILFFVIAYIVFTMFSGRRGTQIVYLITMLIIYHRYVHNIKINPKKMIAFCILGHLGIAILMTMGDLRTISNLNSSIILDSLQDNLAGKIYADLVSEFGGSGISLAYSFLIFPSYHPYSYGQTYLYSFLQIFPNVMGFLNNFEEHLIFVKAFPKLYQASLGGSFLGELFFNFGNLGSIFCLPIGMWIGSFQLRLDKDFVNKKEFVSLRNVALFLIAPSLLVWIRGYFAAFIRVYFLYFALLFIVAPRYKMIDYSKILSKLKGKNL